MNKNLICVGVALSLTTHAFAACEYERDKLRDMNNACDTAKTTNDVVSGACIVGGAIAAACTGNVLFAFIGLGGIPSSYFAEKLCDLKRRREDCLRACEDIEAFKAQQKQESLRLEWITKQNKAVSIIAAQKFMGHVERMKREMEAEIEQLFEDAVDSGRISTDPANPTSQEILAQLAIEEAAIRAKFF